MQKLPDHKAFELVEKYKIPVVEWGFGKNLREIELIAENIGYPVVIKADSPEPFHKSDAGAVQFVYNKEELGNKYNAAVRGAEKRVKKINGMIAQKLVSGREFFIGVKQDEQFGPVIGFGLGGIFVEVLKDVEFRIIPITENDALSMIKGTHAYKILSARGMDIKKPLKVITDILVNISRMIESEGIRELDINPLIISNKGVWVVDVRMMV